MTSKPSNFYDRRGFIKITGLLLSGFFLVLLQQLVSKYLVLNGARGVQSVNLKDKPDGVYFYSSFLIIKEEDNIKVFDNHCTHAGCKINKETNGRIVCACHGSSYNLDGKVLSGPAPAALKALPFSLDHSSGIVTVNME